MSCWRITGICTVAKDAQNGHSKSEYSVTSTGAASEPSVNPRNPSLAATGVGWLAAGAAEVLREPYQMTPPPINTTAASRDRKSVVQGKSRESRACRDS